MIITSTITIEAVKELGLVEGKEATAIVKATSVMIEDEKGLSARNRLAGKVIEIKEGAVNAIVKLQLPSGDVISSTITGISKKSRVRSRKRSNCCNKSNFCYDGIILNNLFKGYVLK